ncbi:MAG: NADH-quinone oxidoreductase subunit NuoF [Chitinispirillaceae bacterium]|nr:NADH-quinone oxidoreductase subunit NuoF [Chitinispirillaceae bacterium]
MKKVASPTELETVRKEILRNRDPNLPCITVCSGTGCHAHGCVDVVAAFKREIIARKLEEKVSLRATGCHGFCERGTLVVVKPEGTLYQKVKPDDVGEILDTSIVRLGVVERLLYKEPVSGEKIRKEKDIPFYKKQNRLLLGQNGIIDPTEIDDYVAAGGYEALAKALSIKPDTIIDVVKKSKLRGRGGAGFPTGRKWEFCRAVEADCRYIICNADEGDPGAYMDRSVLEGNPHSVLEGMIIGSYAIGANDGYIYVRAEYPLAVKHIRTAISQAEEYGLLGDSILGSSHNFRVTVTTGAGAFVCGEETALIASIEGRRGMPRTRPPFPAQKGLFGKPTNINNVETWANIPLIISKGFEWYNTIGTHDSKGTKIFSLVGKINNTGLVEVPMGITLREIVFDIGGGIPKGKRFKAVQTGGPSGGCIPETLLDLPVDFDELTKAGSIMGSGGLIVMDEDTCMVDVARYFLNFLREESCGKCTACREGIVRMLEILERICEGKGEEGDVALLEETGEYIVDTALCALGSTAANPVLSTLKHFSNEYDAHIKEKYCPAGVCKNLFRYSIDEKLCRGCTACVKQCPTGAIKGEKKKAHIIDPDTCIKCGICLDTCKFNAIKKMAVHEVAV